MHSAELYVAIIHVSKACGINYRLVMTENVVGRYFNGFMMFMRM